jgi:hypothetical protein
MDKIPMAPGFGQQPRFIVTIQPVGTTFNPPAALTLPNVEGLAPREITEMYSYDHDLAAFVAIGTGTVSVDGSTIVSDPGVGVLKAGWHCGGNPAAAGTVADCPTCKICDGTKCIEDAAKTCTCCNKNGVCKNGSCNPVGAGACAAKAPVVPTVTNLGDWPGCTPFGLTKPAQQPAPTVSACSSSDCTWGFRVGAYNSPVNAAACCTTRINITGPNDPQVTAATYCAVIQDLTPDPTGRPSRNAYWSRSITTRHENFHVQEWRTALTGRWPAFQNAVEALTAAFSCNADSPASALAAQKATIDNSFNAMIHNTYADWNATGEDPAYADGKASYQALVDGVCTRARAPGKKWNISNPCVGCP